MPSEWEYPTSKCHTLSPSAAFDILHSAGAGTTLNSSNNGGYLKKGRQDNNYLATWWSSDFHYWFNNNDVDADLCRGDSGSPAWQNSGVAGISSETEVANSSSNCRTSSSWKSWYTEIARKLPWIEARLPNTRIYSCPVGGSPCCKRVLGTVQCF